MLATRPVVLVIGLSFAGGWGVARADNITLSASASNYLGDIRSGEASGVNSGGVSFLITGTLAEAKASVNQSGQLHLGVAVSAGPAVPADAGQNSGVASARWSDRIYLSGSTGLLPDIVRLTFSVDGGLTGESFAGLTVGSGSLAINQGVAGFDGDGLSYLGFRTYSRVSPDGQRPTSETTNFNQSGFLLNLPPTPVSGDFRLSTDGVGRLYADVGAFFNVSAHSYYNLGGAARFTNSAVLTGVTLPGEGDATPESLGLGVSFESGLGSPNVAAAAPTPVPAPPGLVLVGVAAVMAVGRRVAASRLRDRRQSV